jgi:hypothetical protein
MRILLIFLLLVINGYAGEQHWFNSPKTYLLQKSGAYVDSVQNSEKKSAFRAAVYSALIPGTGEFYAGSFWKGALFAGLEIAAWTTHFVYDAKGSDKDIEMRNYADAHWSEKKYWSWLYYKGGLDDLVMNMPEYQNLNYTVSLDHDGNPIIQDYSAEVADNLRFLEDALNHTHRLPETKTQQYYEMIYKYLTQFGNAWDDATDFDFSYKDHLTSRMLFYRNLRNDMNHFFDVATTASNVILLNHVLSALDAAWTVHGYNRDLSIKLHSKNEIYLNETVQMYGIHFSW